MRGEVEITVIAQLPVGGGSPAGLKSDGFQIGAAAKYSENLIGFLRRVREPRNLQACGCAAARLCQVLKNARSFQGRRRTCRSHHRLSGPSIRAVEHRIGEYGEHLRSRLA